MSTPAPVIVFAYRRPDHLHRTLASLMRCEGFGRSPVIVYCDGPRGGNEADAVMATRQVARDMLKERAEYHFSDANHGLSQSVIRGVSDAVQRFGRAIVVEDDLDLSPNFLTFLNHGLDRYANEPGVFQVSGYMADVPALRHSPSALFLPFTVSWGWATWKRAWDRFDPSASGWEVLRGDAALRRRFNVDGAYDYTTMLMRQMSGMRDSWAIRWYWAVFKADGLVLFPPISLVRNTGFDGSGTHGRGRFRRVDAHGAVASVTVQDIRFPDKVTLDAELYAEVKAALWRANGGWLAYAIDRARRILRH